MLLVVPAACVVLPVLGWLPSRTRSAPDRWTADFIACSYRRAVSMDGWDKRRLSALFRFGRHSGPLPDLPPRSARLRMAPKAAMTWHWTGIGFQRAGKKEGQIFMKKTITAVCILSASSLCAHAPTDSYGWLNNDRLEPDTVRLSSKTAIRRAIPPHGCWTCRSSIAHRGLYDTDDACQREQYRLWVHQFFPDYDMLWSTCPKSAQALAEPIPNGLRP